MSRSLFNRVVVKLSGEALNGPGTGRWAERRATLDRIASDLKAAADLGVQVAVVVGGGNFFRGLPGRTRASNGRGPISIGTLATVMNALAMEGVLEQIGQPARVLSAVADAVTLPALLAAGGARPSRQRRVILPWAARAIRSSPPTPARPCAPAEFSRER